MVKTSRLVLGVASAVLIASSLFAQERRADSPQVRGQGARLFAESTTLGQIQTNTLGDLRADLLYTPLNQPCRLADTRLAGGILAAGVPRDFFVFEVGGTDISGQGGTLGGCGIPINAAAALLNFVSVTPAGVGNLKGAVWGQPIPTTGSILNYAAVPGMSLANGIPFPACQTLCPSDITVQANASATHLVIDVLGYFLKHQSAFIHTATVANIVGVYTTIDNALTNGNPTAMLQVTQNWNPNGAPVYNNHSIAVFFLPTPAPGKWAIFNEDVVAVPVGAAFNVLVINP